ncbi:MAG TPA: Fe-S cluster assembly protein SufD [Thermoanaerobaculia bacterium]|nr:Fe-S cluster assembly protein SufD [Thermoanaerobaculia bacterium]
MAATVETPAAGLAADAQSVFLADWERFAAARPRGEPGVLAALRRRAFERFAEVGFPSQREEQWRFMDLAPLAQRAFRRAEEGVYVPAEAEVAPHRIPGALELVFADGRLVPQLSRVAGLPAGAAVTGLAEPLARDPERLLPHLGRYASFERHPFVALATAFLEDGAYVEVPAGAVLEAPVHLIFLAAGGPAPTASFPRLLIVAGEASQLTVVETYAGAGVYLTAPVTELLAGPGAVVDHYKVQRESPEAFHFATFQLQAERQSAPSSHSLAFGGALVRNDVNALLAGEGVDCILNGLYVLEGRQFVDNHMRVEHAAPHCGSHELYKGVLDGHSRAVFNGLIYVRPGAQKTDAKQSNRNLLLSPHAMANSNPQLEIFADDVKCTHGSTVGQLDDDAIFYLRSRGIGAEAARSLLTYAFASDIVERVKVEAVRRDLEEFLFTRLPKGEVVRQAV